MPHLLLYTAPASSLVCVVVAVQGPGLPASVEPFPLPFTSHTLTLSCHLRCVHRLRCALHGQCVVMCSPLLDCGRRSWGCRGCPGTVQCAPASRDRSRWRWHAPSQVQEPGHTRWYRSAHKAAQLSPSTHLMGSSGGGSAVCALCVYEVWFGTMTVLDVMEALFARNPTFFRPFPLTTSRCTQLTQQAAVVRPAVQPLPKRIVRGVDLYLVFIFVVLCCAVR